MTYTIPFLHDYVFPNLVLPNAIINELGIINYIHTMYTNRIQKNSFFDFGSQENFLNGSSFGNLSKVFDYELGNFPNSQGYETHLHSGAYRHILNGVEESVYFGKKMYPKYIYPILVSPHFDEFTGVNVQNYPKLNGEYFWKHISAEVLDDARKGTAIILLDFGQENYVEKESYHRLHECLRYSRIPKENIILAFNSFNSKQIYEMWFPEEERRLEVHNWPGVVANTSFHFNSMIEHKDPSCVLEQDFIESRNTPRPNKFLFKIRRPRGHRMALLFYMASENLLDLGDWSCLSPLDYRQNEIDYMRNYYDLYMDESVVKTLYDKIPHNLQVEPLSNFTNVSAWNDTTSVSYLNTYFYICSETFTQVHGDYKSITEKVFKPMVNYLPFVFVAYPGALQLLRNLGFKTFHPFIDESYDTELNESKRLNMLGKEIKRICSMSKEELHVWYWSMESILRHNRSHTQSWYKNDVVSLEFIKYLHTRVST